MIVTIECRKDETFRSLFRIAVKPHAQVKLSYVLAPREFDIDNCSVPSLTDAADATLYATRLCQPGVRSARPTLAWLR